MNINQVKKLRKIVRIKKLATKNNKIFVCTMKKTSVHYRMVLTIIPCLFLFLCPISNIEKIFMHILVFRPFQSSSLMITSQTMSHPAFCNMLFVSLKHENLDQQFFLGSLHVLFLVLIKVNYDLL